jgi:hypothetical protein
VDELVSADIFQCARKCGSKSDPNVGIFHEVPQLLAAGRSEATLHGSSPKTLIYENRFQATPRIN